MCLQVQAEVLFFFQILCKKFMEQNIFPLQLKSSLETGDKLIII